MSGSYNPSTIFMTARCCLRYDVAMNRTLKTTRNQLPPCAKILYPLGFGVLFIGAGGFFEYDRSTPEMDGPSFFDACAARPNQKHHKRNWVIAYSGPHLAANGAANLSTETSGSLFGGYPGNGAIIDSPYEATSRSNVTHKK